MGIIIILLLLFIPSSSLFAEAVDLVDIPTAEIVDHNHYGTNFRLYQGAGGGSILTRLSFGLGKKINLGLSIDLADFIGQERIDFQRPEMQIKYRFFDGSQSLPAFALGYDSQGYHYSELNKTNNKGYRGYSYPEKGLYLVGSREILTATEAHFGTNIYDFDSDKFYGFLGLSWAPAEEITFMVEVDALHKPKSGEKLGRQLIMNSGIRYHHTTNLSIEVSVRNLTRYQKIATERVLRINYQGKF